MSTWGKVTTVIILAVVALVALAGTGAFYVFRNMQRGPASEADVNLEIDAVRARFPGRTPLIEIIDPKAGDIRVNRTTHADGRRAQTIHVLAWDPDDGTRVRMDFPVWLMRFSSANVLSRLGIAPSKYRLTVDDVRSYGPGIVADFRQSEGHYVMIWLE